MHETRWKCKKLILSKKKKVKDNLIGHQRMSITLILFPNTVNISHSFMNISTGSYTETSTNVFRSQTRHLKPSSPVNDILALLIWYPVSFYHRKEWLVEFNWKVLWFHLDGVQEMNTPIVVAVVQGRSYVLCGIQASFPPLLYGRLLLLDPRQNFKKRIQEAPFARDPIN